MRGHLPALDHGRMDPAPARYVIRINGHLGATVLSAFPALAPQHHGAHTVLTGLLDRSALYGVLAEIEALGRGELECSDSRVPRRRRRTREGSGRTDVDVRLRRPAGHGGGRPGGHAGLPRRGRAPGRAAPP